MLEGRELWDRLQQDICKIILNSKSNIVFLVGDNSTGKSEIGEILKDQITVLDNYKGTFDEIPKDRRVLVITHKVELLLQAEPITTVIITRTNGLYISTDCDIDDYGHIVHKIYNSEPMSIFLINSVSGSWSELNEEYLQEYLSINKLNKADESILKTIESFKTA